MSAAFVGATKPHNMFAGLMPQNRILTSCWGCVEWLSTGCRCDVYRIFLRREPNKSLLLLTVILLETYENCVLIIIIIFIASLSLFKVWVFTVLVRLICWNITANWWRKEIRRIPRETFESECINCCGKECSHIVLCCANGAANRRISCQVSRESKGGVACAWCGEDGLKTTCVPFPFHPKCVRFTHIWFYDIFWFLFPT